METSPLDWQEQFTPRDKWVRDLRDLLTEDLQVVQHTTLAYDFRYSDRWYPETDGGGPSLVIRDPHGDLSSWNFAESWRVSRQPRGSPGIDEEAPPPGGRRRGGDFNSDAALQLSDAVGLLGYLFIDAAAGLPCEGEIEGAGNLALLDSNGDGQVDLTDAVYVLGFLFLGGPQPVQGTACVTIPGCAESCSQ